VGGSDRRQGEEAQGIEGEGQTEESEGGTGWGGYRNGSTWGVWDVQKSRKNGGMVSGSIEEKTLE